MALYQYLLMIQMIISSKQYCFQIIKYETTHSLKTVYTAYHNSTTGDTP